ncbi:L-type lectin-domain containing receptor kinase IX.1, partial [Camellia lanceoleosa]
MNTSQSKPHTNILFSFGTNTSVKFTDFNTNFTFVNDSKGSNVYGDGITFFLVPNGSTPNITAGGAIGLPLDLLTLRLTTPFVFVEFDTYRIGVGTQKHHMYRTKEIYIWCGELFHATDNFAEEHKLGEGGFGGVYRGFLRESNSYVAVKRISKGSKQGIKEYASEVKIITQLRHRNLVQLIGWYHDKRELLLVYEFMENRILDYHLFKEKSLLDYHLFKEKSLLTWARRYKIAQGLASALFSEWEQCVVHNDVKSSNVMLDSNFNAKLGDFGLARLVDHGKNSQTTILAGTRGYTVLECLITEWVTFCFTVVTGVLAEIHAVHSWNFTCNIQIAPNLLNPTGLKPTFANQDRNRTNKRVAKQDLRSFHTKNWPLQQETLWRERSSDKVDLAAFIE